MGLPGMFFSGIAGVVGAITYWAVTAQSSNSVQNHGFRLSTVGVILMIAGGVGFIASLIVFFTSRRAPSVPDRTVNHITKDEAGRTTELPEEQH